MATNLGTAYVSVMPSMKGFGKAVESGMSGVDTTSAGTKMGSKAASGFAGGMAKNGAVIGAASALATKAFDAVAQSAGRAVSRVDTMANFPKVMGNIGYSADDAAKSIQSMSDSLDGLPTSLDTMTAMVQQLAPLSGSLDEATTIGLAFNNMMLASGASTMAQQSAIMQYTQALAKGKPDMQDWKALQQVMPGQLNQVAQAMLGATANSTDLYNALKDGTVTMGDFNDAVVRLNTEGANGFASFEQQAKDSTQGIQTALDNLQTRTAKGLANIVESIGQENISGAINFLSSQIGGISSSLASGVKTAVDVMKPLAPIAQDVVSGLAAIAPAAIAAWGAFKLFKGGRAVFEGTAGTVGALSGRVQGLGLQTLLMGNNMASAGKAGASAFQGIGRAMGSLSPAKLTGVTLLIAAMAYEVVGLAGVFMDAHEKQETFSNSLKNIADGTSGVNNLLDNTNGVTRDLSSSMGDLSTNVQTAAVDIDSFLKTQADYAESLVKVRDNAETEIITLNSAREAIAEFAGQSDLSAENQGRLQAALSIVNDALGTNYQLVDAANGAISDSAGNYDEAAGAAGKYKDAILSAIDAKKMEIQAEAMTENLKTGYKARTEALDTYTKSVRDLHEAEARYSDAAANGDTYAIGALQDATSAVEIAKGEYDAWNDSVKSTEEAFGMLSSAMDGTADAFSTFATGASGFSSILQSAGVDAGAFKTAFDEVGVSIGTLASMGTEDLVNLATAFKSNGGDIVAAIDGINAAKLESKRAEVQIDSGELLDAQGNVYTWNGTEFHDKAGNAIVDDTSLIDAQGNVWTWNGTEFVHQQTGATVDQGSLVEAQGRLDTWNGTEFQVKKTRTETNTDSVTRAKSIWDGWHPATKVLTVVTNSIQNVIRTFTGKNAAGGFLQLHAGGGFIVDRPTALGRDSRGVVHVAGEDGAEWVMNHADGTTSIVPVQNRKYMEPYADVIASMLGGSQATSYNLTLNYTGRENPNDIVRAMRLGFQRMEMMEA